MDKAPFIKRKYRGVIYNEVKYANSDILGYTINVLGGKFSCNNLHDMKQFIDMLVCLYKGDTDEDDRTA